MTILTDNKFAQLAANYLTSDFNGLRKINPAVTLPSPENFAELIKMAEGGEISSRGAKDILAVLVAEGGAPRAIAETKGLFQKSDEGALLLIVDEIISANEKVVGEYKAGNERSLQFLVGQGMKASQGSANPGILAKLFKGRLG
jgi:aspartyl-tRNA(Asn)/glutamyl-tRNA(Gln) amidotransferase subunit B